MSERAKAYAMPSSCCASRQTLEVIVLYNIIYTNGYFLIFVAKKCHYFVILIWVNSSMEIEETYIPYYNHLTDSRCSRQKSCNSSGLAHIIAGKDIVWYIWELGMALNSM